MKRFLRFLALVTALIICVVMILTSYQMISHIHANHCDAKNCHVCEGFQLFFSLFKSCMALLFIRVTYFMMRENGGFVPAFMSIFYPFSLVSLHIRMDN